MMKNWLLKTLLALMFISLGAFAQLTPGQTAPDVNLPGNDGKNHSFGEFSGKKAIVVIFMSIDCPVSNAYVERIAALFDEFSGKNVEFVGVFSNRREDLPAVTQYAAEKGIKYTVLRDEDNKVADEFGAQFTPEVYVLNPQRVILYHGRIDYSQREKHVRRKDLQEALAEVLAGKPVSEARTKSFGCSIKRSK